MDQTCYYCGMRISNEPTRYRLYQPCHTLYYGLQLAKQYRDDQNAEYFRIAIYNIAWGHGLTKEYALWITAMFLFPSITTTWPDEVSPFDANATFGEMPLVQ